MKKINNIKAIGSIVAVSLLIVVAVVAVTGFNTWFNSFSSNLQSKSETQTDNSISLDSQLIQKTSTGIKIYIKNPSTQTIRLNQIKINSQECNLTNSDVMSPKSITLIDVDCNYNKGSNLEVTLFTNSGISTKKLILK